MKVIHIFGYSTIVASFVGMSIFVMALPARAHDGVDHSVAENSSEAELERLQSLVLILQHLVEVLTEYRAQYGTLQIQPTPVPTAQIVVPVEVHAHDNHAETTDAPAAAVEPKLVIELEEHSGKTHVHVRYVDKPEAMFFVDPPLSDENAVVSAIATRTGLGESEIRSALKYTGMH